MGDDAKTVFERSPRSEPAQPHDPTAPTAVTAPDESGSRYQRGAEIARGGMGRVVEAVDRVLGRVVALKEVLTTDREALRRFARETRITARLEHPSIVPVHDAGTLPDGSPFYVMRKLSGRPLEQLVAEATTLNQRLALLPHIVAAAQAIAHAHARGVVHRDIKPSNILAGSLGETVVIDWGLAKVLDEPDDPDDPVAEGGPDAFVDAGGSLRTRVGVVFGTPGFMPPEQLSGERVDERADVYALGATLYYLLARSTPHGGSSGTEMMGAALAGPATPLGVRVPGVPPELSTIVDKALAYEHAARYPHAGALAEDLQRFLTGQLVASHHYSRRERTTRFVRKHRLALAIAGVAIIALGIGGTLAITRIIAARDRTDLALTSALAQTVRADRALQDVLEKNRRLVLLQAEMLLPTNPTAAVALVKPLVQTNWPEVRAIGMAARARGAAWGYAAAPETYSLSLDTTGTRCLAIGRDHVIRILDLVRHTTRVVATVADVEWGAFAANDTLIVTWSATQIIVIDLKTGAQRALAREHSRTTERLSIVDHLAFWVDSSGRAFELDLDAATLSPRVLAVGEPISVIAPSPDLRRIAIGTTTHLWLVERTGSAPPQKILDGSTFQIEWSPNSQQLTANVEGHAVWVQLEPRPRVLGRTTGIAYSSITRDDATYVASRGALLRLTPEGERTKFKRDDFSVLTVVAARDDAIVSYSQDGKILVVTEATQQIIQAPVGALFTIATSPGSRFVVASAPNLVLAWDLDQILPARVPLPPNVRTFTVLGTHQLIAQFSDHAAIWFDLQTRTTKTIAHSEGEHFKVAGALDGDVAMGIDHRNAAFLVHRDSDIVVPIDAPVEFVVFPSKAHAIITSGGQVHRYTVATRQRTLLFERKGTSATGIATASTRLAGRFDDGLLWRHDLVTGHDDVLARPFVGTSQWLEIDPDGTIYFPESDQLWKWTADQRVTMVAQLPRAIRDAVILDNAQLLVTTTDGASYLVELATGGVTSRLASGTRFRALTRQLAITLDRETLLALDASSNIRWPIARTALIFGALAVASDGQRVFSSVDGTILEWRLEVPTTQDATARWIDTLTNARAPTGPTVLTWE